MSSRSAMAALSFRSKTVTSGRSRSPLRRSQRPHRQRPSRAAFAADEEPHQRRFQMVAPVHKPPHHPDPKPSNEVRKKKADEAAAKNYDPTAAQAEAAERAGFILGPATSF